MDSITSEIFSLSFGDTLKYIFHLIIICYCLLLNGSCITFEENLILSNQILNTLFLYGMTLGRLIIERPVSHLMDSFLVLWFCVCLFCF